MNVSTSTDYGSGRGSVTRGLNLLTVTMVLALGAAHAGVAPAGSGTVSSVQAKVRPSGLDIVSPVMAAGSDADAATFQAEALPGINALLNVSLGEKKAVNSASMQLDPSQLVLKTDSDVRVYFVGEGAGYANTLGFNTSGLGIASGDPLLIFPNASSSVSTYDPQKTATRSTSAPLLPGDFVNLGTIEGGSKLNFFLIANGANGGGRVYSTDISTNPDGLNHVVAFTYALPGSPYLIIGFEDLFGGGDKDFNDLIFAVDIGMANIAALTGTPEPALLLTLGSMVGAIAWIKRRRARAEIGVCPAAA